MKMTRKLKAKYYLWKKKQNNENKIINWILRGIELEWIQFARQIIICRRLQSVPDNDKDARAICAISFDSDETKQLR